MFLSRVRHRKNTVHPLRVCSDNTPNTFGTLGSSVAESSEDAHSFLFFWWSFRIICSFTIYIHILHTVVKLSSGLGSEVIVGHLFTKSSGSGKTCLPSCYKAQHWIAVGVFNWYFQVISCSVLFFQRLLCRNKRVEFGGKDESVKQPCRLWLI